MTRHAQTTQNNKFAISLQYLKKEVNIKETYNNFGLSDEVDILHADEHESFLQIDSLIFDGDGNTFAKKKVCNNVTNI